MKFNDTVCGPQACNPAQHLGAFPITQKSGDPSYQLAVVVDDAAMGITEVVRGDDLIVSTFRQLDLYHALGYTPPRYAHVPLVCGPDRRRLAKRHGDTRLSLCREEGLPASKIVTWAARSCGLLDEHQSVRSASELIERFQWNRLSRSEVVIDPATL
jgi:glutamyl-tRNA synthetase